jgi:ABC-type methionine transport system permease subunit
MSEMTSLLQTVVKELVKVKEQHGEQIVSTVLETASLMAMTSLIQSAVGIVLSIVVLWYIFSYKPEKDIELDGFLKQIFGFQISIVCIIILMVSIPKITNPILWKGMTKPEVYLTYKLLEKTKK